MGIDGTRWGNAVDRAARAATRRASRPDIAPSAVRLGFALACVAAITAGAGPARADDLDDADFGLRFTSALSRFSRYPDVAALGGASGGSPWASSHNPASLAMNPPVDVRHFGTSAQWAGVKFDEGTTVQVAAVSVAYETPHAGVFEPAFLAVQSNRATTRDGLTFEWEGLGFDLEWATKVSPCTTVGVDLGAIGTETDFDLGPAKVTHSRSTTWSATAGVLHQFCENIYGGFSAIWSAAPSTTWSYDFMNTGSGTIKSKDTTNEILLRPGVYDLITKELSVYADYVFSHFSDDAGSLTVHRFSAGFDYTVREGIYVRGGAMIDFFGNVSPTAGIGITPSKQVAIDISWQYDMFPEIHQEFGRSQELGIGLTIMF